MGQAKDPSVANSPPTARKPRKKTKRRKSEEWVSHVIRVKAWQFYYSRRATDPKSKWERGSVSEFADLEFIGEVIRPEKCKYKEGKLTLSGKEDLLDHEPSESRKPIGSAMARGEEIEGYVFVPEDRLRLLLTAAQSGRIEVAQFTGPKLRYGGGQIHSISLNTHFDEDEW